MRSQLIKASTIVTYPGGAVRGISGIVEAISINTKQWALFVEKTPFHPVDQHWPDQPADRGVIKIKDLSLEVEDCQIFAVHKKDGMLQMESHKIEKHDKSNWHYIVAHIVTHDDARDFINQEADLIVDAEYRQLLNVHHSACHLAGLALNKALQHLWNKTPDRHDAFGFPDFDKLALEKSTIFPDKSSDQYRLGRSIKKKGLDVEKLSTSLESITQHVNQQLHEWIATDAVVSIAPSESTFETRREWVCQLPKQTATMPCGGTHIKRLSELQGISYKLSLRDENLIAEAMVSPELKFEEKQSQALESTVSDNKNVQEHKVSTIPLFSSQQTPVLYLAATGQLEELKVALARNPDDVLKKDHFQNNLLMHAVRGGHVSVVDFLLQPEWSLSINEQNDFGNTALHIAASFNITAVIPTLLDHGADRNQENNEGKTPLQIAAARGYQDIVSALPNQDSFQLKR